MSVDLLRSGKTTVGRKVLDLLVELVQMDGNRKRAQMLLLLNIVVIHVAHLPKEFSSFFILFLASRPCRK